MDSFNVTFSILNWGSVDGGFGRVLSVSTVVHWLAKRVLKILAFSRELVMKEPFESIGGITENLVYPLVFLEKSGRLLDLIVSFSVYHQVCGSIFHELQ